MSFATGKRRSSISAGKADTLTAPSIRCRRGVRRMRAKAGGIRALNSEPIAIVGIGCRYPGGVHDAESFWHLLHHGVDAITQVPAERWDVEAFYDPNPETPGKTYTRWGGFVPGS